MSIGLEDIHGLHGAIRACRRCEDDGFPIQPPPIADGIAPAPFMLIGQAPSLTDMRMEKLYQGPAAQKLLAWLFKAGFSESDIGTTVYMTALTKCFPGRILGKSTDRAPTPKELANCSTWLAKQMALVRPRVVILFGKMAIEQILGLRTSLARLIGTEIERDGIWYLPLPHSSGASTWLNHREHQLLLEQAILLLAERRKETI